MALKTRRIMDETAVVYTALSLLRFVHHADICADSIRHVLMYGAKDAYKKAKESWIRDIGLELHARKFIEQPVFRENESEVTYVTIDGLTKTTVWATKRGHFYYPYDVLLDGCYNVIEHASRKVRRRKE